MNAEAAGSGWGRSTDLPARLWSCAWSSREWCALLVGSVFALAGGSMAVGEEPAKPVATESPGADKTEPPASAPPAVVGTIEGRAIRKSDGRPLADADVRLVNKQQSRIPLKMTRARSDAEGRFTFTEVPPGKYRVWAFHEDLISRGRRFEGASVEIDKDGTTSTSPVLEMWPGNRLKVHVDSSVTGQPVAGAKVRLTWTDTDRDHLTDAEGNVEIRGLTPEAWHIEVFFDGHAEEVKQIALVPEQLPTEVSLVLRPGGAVSGVVKDAHGQPLKGVGISVFGADHSGGQIEYLTTDADGKYEFPYLPLIPLELSCSKDDYVSRRENVSLSQTDRQKVIDIALDRRPYGGGVLATVTNEQGEPIAGATLNNVGRSSRDERKGTTGADGVCLLEDLFKSHAGHELVVRAAGYAPTRLSCEPGPKGEPTPLSVVLERGHRLHGRVVLAQGKPGTGVTVYFANGERGFGGIGGSVQTDKEGRFSLDSLPNPCTFTFYPPRGYSGLDDLPLPLDGDEEVLVELKPSGAVRGRAVDADSGEGLRNFQVRIWFAIPRDPNVNSLLGSLSEPREFSGTDGRFEVPDLIAGAAYQLTIQAAGYDRHVIDSFLATRADEPLPEVRVAKVRPDQFMEVGGRVVLDGRPMPGVQVRLIVAKERPARGEFPFGWGMVQSGQIERNSKCLQFLKTSTDDAGAFHFAGVQKGLPLQIAYWGGGVANGCIDMPDDRTEAALRDWTIEAEKSARVTIRIDRIGWPKAKEILFSASQAAFDYRHVSLEEESGPVTIDGLPPGTYYVSVNGPSVRTGEDSSSPLASESIGIRLAAGESRTLEIGVDGWTAGGSLKKADGDNTPVVWEQGSVRLELKLPRPPSPVRPTPDIQARPELYRAWRETWLQSDTGREWQRLTNEYQERSMAGPSYSARLDPSGTFQLFDVAPGDYELTVSFRDRRFRSSPKFHVIIPSTSERVEGGVLDLGVLTVE